MEYINEIAIGAVVVLLGAHFGLHFYFKSVKKKQDRERAKKKAELEQAFGNQPPNKHGSEQNT